MDPDEMVDEAGAETFPASDPPPWTLGPPSHDHPHPAVEPPAADDDKDDAKAEPKKPKR